MKKKFVVMFIKNTIYDKEKIDGINYSHINLSDKN